MSTFRRQSLIAYGQPLRETVAERPAPRGTEVLIRVTCCGVCHSDLHVQDGYFALRGDKRLDITKDRALPFTLGHEIAGVVEAAGESADGGVVGREVAVYPWIGCGACPACRAGEENMCSAHHHLGVAADGGFATYVLVPHPRYLLDHAPLPATFAGPLMCSGLTAYSALKRLGAHAERGPVLLVGLGGVGMMGLAFARAMFAQKISVADLSPAAREAALENGADVAYDPTEPEIAKRIIRETEGGFDEIVDFAGNEKSMAFAVSAVARGGKIVVSGLMGGNFNLPMVQWIYKRLTIEGFMVGTLAEGHELMALARAGKIKPVPMREEPMGDVQKWIDALRAGKVVGRIVLKNEG
jgi:D-arabinose 1-dehydrogenase-like Zn-dependent alcohol dehydrogenase